MAKNSYTFDVNVTLQILILKIDCFVSDVDEFQSLFKSPGILKRSCEKIISFFTFKITQQHCFIHRITSIFYAANNPPTVTVQGGTEIILTAGATPSITVTVDDQDAGDTATLEKVNNTVLNTDCITLMGVTPDQYTVTIDTSDLLHCDVA